MQRRSFLKKAAVGAAATAGAVLAACSKKEKAPKSEVSAPAIVSSQPKIEWRLAASWPKSLETLYGGPELIARRVGEITDGKFQIRAFAAGEIVPALQVLDAVQAGTVELGHTASYYYAGKDPSFALATAVPFGLDARQQNAWWYEGGGKEVMAPLYKEWGCIAMYAGNTGAQMGGWWRKQIRSLNDLKGVKFRIGGLIAGEVVKRGWGVVPTSLGGPDIYPALEKGAIDAAEWVGPYDDERLGFNKVAKYYYYPGFWEPGAALQTLVNEKKWNELPKAYQAALEAACGEANVWMQAKYDVVNVPALKRLIGTGTKLEAFPGPVLSAAAKAAFEIYDELKGKSKHWDRIYPQWKQFRSDSNSWFRVDENTDDNFRLHTKYGA